MKTTLTAALVVATLITPAHADTSWGQRLSDWFGGNSTHGLISSADGQPRDNLNAPHFGQGRGVVNSNDNRIMRTTITPGEQGIGAVVMRVRDLRDRSDAVVTVRTSDGRTFQKRFSQQGPKANGKRQTIRFDGVETYDPVTVTIRTFSGDNGLGNGWDFIDGYTNANCEPRRPQVVAPRPAKAQARAIERKSDKARGARHETKASKSHGTRNGGGKAHSGGKHGRDGNGKGKR